MKLKLLKNLIMLLMFSIKDLVNLLEEFMKLKLMKGKSLKLMMEIQDLNKQQLDLEIGQI